MYFIFLLDHLCTTCTVWESRITFSPLCILCNFFIQTTFAPSPLGSFELNFKGLTFGWPSFKIDEISLVWWNCRSPELKLDFKHENFKVLIWNCKHLIRFFKSLPWGKNWPLPRSHMICIGLITFLIFCETPRDFC